MITRLTIEKRELFAGGYEFPLAGAYEKLSGKAYGEVDPRGRLNRVTVNLERAPRNRDGKVEYSTDFIILKPVDILKGNRRVLYEPPNRGNLRMLMSFNDAPETNDPSSLEHAGNGFLMREGYTLVWCGWQGDLIPAQGLLAMRVPVATDRGKEIVGKVRAEIVVYREGVKSCPLSGDNQVISYEAASRDKSRASLTVRERSYARRKRVPKSEWDFAEDLCLFSGFRPGHIYEQVYPAKNPLVLGLGFAATRDVVSFLRYASQDRDGNRNPLVAKEDDIPIEKVYAWGRSQSGRFLRDFVYHGFNEDESGRRVFDAIFPHAAGGGRLFLNYEFARPGSSAQQHTHQLDPELFPFAYSRLEDPQTGRRDGILKRPKSDPHVFHVQTSTEYWQKRGCLVHTDGKGRDIPIPERVRIYAIASAPHNSSLASLPGRGMCGLPINPMPVGAVLRALLVALDRWVTQGVRPPPSQIPRVRDGTLVPPDRRSTGFPQIPGVRYSGVYNRQLFLDYGPDLEHGKIDFHPPKRVKNGAYTILVPKVDIDGNDLGGIRLPAIRVPLGTYTGWNFFRAGLPEGELCGLNGAYLPFARTREERERLGDPRLSLEERYEDHAGYVRKITREAKALVAERFLLPEDAQRIIEEAINCPLWSTDVSFSRRTGA